MAKILIVDDDFDTISLFEKFINANGHQTYSVIDSQLAMHAVDSFKPDLIILDIMMPHINGITLCKLIKANVNTKSVPVVIVSALDDSGTKRDVTNAGANLFLNKPIIPKTFLQGINSLLNK